MKKLFLFLSIASLSLNSCSKKDDPVTVTACFEDSFNGTYKGTDGGYPLEPEVIVKLTKTGCTTATLESSILGNRNVKDISASSAGAYVGKLDSGASISIGLSGSSLNVSSTGYASFSGTKQ
jgi:hypothetical protein